MTQFQMMAFATNISRRRGPDQPTENGRFTTCTWLLWFDGCPVSFQMKIWELISNMTFQRIVSVKLEHYSSVARNFAATHPIFGNLQLLPEREEHKWSLPVMAWFWYLLQTVSFDEDLWPFTISQLMKPMKIPSAWRSYDIGNENIYSAKDTEPIYAKLAICFGKYARHTKSRVESHELTCCKRWWYAWARAKGTVNL